MHRWEGTGLLRGNVSDIRFMLTAGYPLTFDSTEVRLAVSWLSALENPESRRADVGGAPWTQVGFVESTAAAATTAEPTSYRFGDADLRYEADPLRPRLKQIDADGTTHFTPPILLRRAAEEVRLFGPAPNPVHRRAPLRYAVPERHEVQPHLYDLLGRRVRTLPQGPQAGRQTVKVNASDLSRRILPSASYRRSDADQAPDGGAVERAGRRLAGRVKQASDRLVGLLKFVVTLDGLLRLQHVSLNPGLVEHVERFGLYLQALVHASSQDHHRGAVIEQFVYVGRLHSGTVGGTGLVPVPRPSPAGIQLCVFKGLRPIIDFEASPRDVRNAG